MTKRGLDRSLFLCYDSFTMKKAMSSLNKPIKMRSRLRPTEFYWTFTEWSSDFVDGVEFLPVTRFEPSHDRTQQLYYVRKDSLEKVKND